MLILVTGKRGAGKSFFASIAKENGFKVIDMSSVVKELMKEQGIEINNKTIRPFADELRKKYGLGAVALFTVDKLDGNEVVAGVRGIEEVKEFRKHFPSILVFIDADIKKRYERMLKAGKKENPMDWNEFLEAEALEERWGLKDIKEQANVVIDNNGTKQEFRQKVEEFLNNLMYNLS